MNAGTLLVNGTLGNTAVSVAPGSRLGGIGTISGTVTIGSGATLAPGLSPGTLTVGSLNLMEGAILDYELATPGVIGGGVNDLVVVTNDLMLDGTLNVTGLPGFWKRHLSADRLRHVAGRQPAQLWFDAGRICLSDPDHRARASEPRSLAHVL